MCAENNQTREAERTYERWPSAPSLGIIIDVAASGRHHAPPPRESHDVIHGCVPPAPISLCACVACSMNFLQEMPKC